ncbi:ABC transporter permease [Cryobacterium roopkundense]|uniref:Transport permease protein n=1 Tax=Cryobacterium roopkundense TaxID=1001240 RepID=A0A7W9E4H9_9MICO|nr:ABC transporter permease [Cryobacterium roopkundense]MBB5642156.1 ABC-2 type transport system permease protein [Cryobacterium roopkundense]
MDSETLEQKRKAERQIFIAEQDFFDAGQPTGFFKGSSRSLVDIWKHRELLSRLVKREIKARYKDSSLGILWSLFRPLVQLLIYYFAIGQILGAARSVPDFAVFVFIGLTMWTLYSEIISGSTTSILGNAGLVKKVYLPREIFPLSSVGSALVNFGIQSIVLLGGIAVLSTFLWSYDLLLAPAAVITILVFGTAVGLLLSALNVYLRDVQHFVEIYLIVFFWVSPIVYPFTFIQNQLNGNWMEQIYLMNPVTLSIIAAQKALWTGGSTGVGDMAQAWPDNLELRLLVAFLCSVVLLWISQRVFSRLQGNFAQEL